MLNLGQCAVSEPVERMLDTMFVQKRVPQALIIEGNHTKATELAHILASALVCQSQENKPCGTCGSCVKAHAGSHPDIYLAEGGLTPRSFKVEAIRAIRSDAYIQSQEGGYKVYLLFRAESMSAEAQNALLKVLEEPPADTVFILTCITANRLLQTIRSRSQITVSYTHLQRNLSENPTIQVTIDVHRDALGGESTRIKPTTVINGRKAAQIMILSGYDGDGSLGFPDWELNLRLALRLQQNCANMEQSFIRPLNFTNSRYNMNATHGSLLVEFGTEVNTIDEVKYSGQLFGDALVKTLESLM